MEAKAAIFLDKDGTLIPDIPYNVNPGLTTLNPGVLEGLYELQQHFSLFIISNQAGVAKGFFGIEEINRLMDYMLELFGRHYIHISGYYFCPHDVHGVISSYTLACNCRKPKPGLLLQAAAGHQLDLSKSWMIGDILNDVEAGKTAGCRSVLIDNGNEAEWDRAGEPFRTPDFIARDFLEAVSFIHQTTQEQNHVRKRYTQPI
ncbi:HAD-IIIA family hydrolase [Pedobacter sp. Leaf176]|uniref:D-glycero-alpha-D-manno-heptose-1,7-bisphosphate 7-phosphatase n=1 Tax=Pedobacter sp. Leaf176 TaxID=1736286 RepID=UPI0006FEBEB7|nr:HAD family hydrolase [Pedobacter sp. Leaf176]KQR67250.1 HAD family hydrolase [Pedobacter sp. Leaf176]